MPYPDSEYPSTLRGRSKRESQRLLAAAPDLLSALKFMYVEFRVLQAMHDRWSEFVLSDAKEAIAKAEGRDG
jgi:hypothetical protein